MTNRRSMPNYGERISRQTQFFPGHVGGRVASAQPVRSRRTIGAAGKADPPTYYYISGKTWDTTSTTWNVSPGGDPDANVGVVFCAGFSTWVPPAGWTELDSGTVGAMKWWLGWRRLTGSDSTTFTRSSVTGLGVSWAKWYTGGSGWTPTASAPTTGTTVSSLSLPSGSGLAEPSQIHAFLPPWTDTGNVATWSQRRDAVVGGSATYPWGTGQSSGLTFDGSPTTDDVWLIDQFTYPAASSVRWWTSSARTTPMSVDAAVGITFGFRA
jgi:hypothetical protein